MWLLHYTSHTLENAVDRTLLSHQLAEWPWESASTSLNPQFLTCKRDVLAEMNPEASLRGDNGDNDEDDNGAIRKALVKFLKLGLGVLWGTELVVWVFAWAKKSREKSSRRATGSADMSYPPGWISGRWKCSLDSWKCQGSDIYLNKDIGLPGVMWDGHSDSTGWVLEWRITAKCQTMKRWVLWLLSSTLHTREMRLYNIRRLPENS